MSTSAPSAAPKNRAAGRSVLALAAAVAVLLAGCGTPELPVAASAQVVVVTPTPTVTPTPEPTPTALPEAAVSPTPEPTPTVAPVRGVTDDTIRVATIVDIQTNGAADGLYSSVLQGAQAWAIWVNQKGGVAGRDVQLVSIDSNLLDHKLAVQQACDLDVFALVGSKSLNDGPGIELLENDDCAMPDFPAAAQSPERRASPVTFVSNAFLDPFAQIGQLKWLAEEFPDAIDSTSIPRVEFPTSLISAEHMAQVALANNYVVVDEPLVRTNEDYDLRIADMEEKEVRTLLWTGDADRLITLLQAADDASFSFEVVLCDSSCHSDRFLDDAGDVGEGVYSWIPHLPFDEALNTPDLAQYDFRSRDVLGYDGRASEGVEAWAAGRLFEESVNLATGAGTVDFDPDALTSGSVLAAAQTINSWDAQGIYGRTNPSSSTPSPCYVLMQIQDNNWERIWPEEAATRDCDVDNLYVLSDPDFGAVATSSTSSDEAIFAGPDTTDDDEEIDVVESTEQIDKFDTEFQEAPNG